MILSLYLMHAITYKTLSSFSPFTRVSAVLLFRSSAFLALGVWRLAFGFAGFFSPLYSLPLPALGCLATPFASGLGSWVCVAHSGFRFLLSLSLPQSCLPHVIAHSPAIISGKWGKLRRTKRGVDFRTAQGRRHRGGIELSSNTFHSSPSSRRSLLLKYQSN